MDAGVTCVLRATRGLFLRGAQSTPSLAPDIVALRACLVVAAGQDILAACGQLNSTKTGNVASDGGVLQSQTLSAH